MTSNTPVDPWCPVLASGRMVFHDATAGERAIRQCRTILLVLHCLFPEALVTDGPAVAFLFTCNIFAQSNSDGETALSPTMRRASLRKHTFRESDIPGVTIDHNPARTK